MVREKRRERQKDRKTERQRKRENREKAHLGPDMGKVHAELLQQRRLAVIALGRKGSQPAGAKTALLAHATGHTGAAAGRAAAAKASVGRRAAARAAVAICALLRRRLARHARRVGRRVELQVLCRRSVRGVAALRTAVVLGHYGRRGSRIESDSQPWAAEREEGEEAGSNERGQGRGDDRQPKAQK